MNGLYGETVISCIVVKRNDAGPPNVLPATVERLDNGTHVGRFVARENGTFFPQCVLLYTNLRQFGAGSGSDFRPKVKINKPETLQPLGTTPAAVTVFNAPSVAVPRRRCDAPGATFGDGRWLPRAQADLEILGPPLPEEFKFYWVPYDCRLVLTPPEEAAQTCPALRDVLFVGDSITGMIFNAVANHLGLAQTSRNKTLEHEMEAAGLINSGDFSSENFHIYKRSGRVPVPPDATAFGLYGVTAEDDYLPGCDGSPLAFVNWGLHDLDCGQPCRMGAISPATPAEYAAGVVAFANAAVDRLGPASSSLIFRTLLPKFGENSCCQGKNSEACFNNWRWRHVDFKIGSAAKLKKLQHCPYNKLNPAAYSRVCRLTVDRAAADSARLLNDFVQNSTYAPRVLDAYPVIASSPTSWSGMHDTTHPAEGSVELHVLMTMFLNLACQNLTTASF